MRKTREPNLFDEKSFISEDASVQSQAACLNRIYRKVHCEGLSAETIQELRDDIDYIAEFYSIDNQSAVLLAAILEKSATNNLMDDEDLAQYLGCTNIEFIRYHKNLREMDKAGIIQMGGGRGPRRCYRATPETLKAVENNCEFKPVKMTGLTTDELFTRFRKLFGSFRNDNIDAERLIEELDTIISYNDHLSFCKKVQESPLYGDCPDTERRMFLYLCHRYVSHGDKSVEIDTLTDFTEFMEDDECLKRHIIHEDTVMQRSGLVSFAIEDGFVDTHSLSLSDRVKAEFLCEVALVPEEIVRHRDIISANAIQAKDLFYNEAEGAQVARLENLLSVENFKEVQKRLASTGMRKGFNAIFYGDPGTGKTASVLELARRSGRDIFRVDMSRLKSKWVGDSEKSVRAVFRMYRSLCKSSEKAPIMLFNEADAIFTKRIENVEQSVDQMNNAIQNIILEEMENIEGILIATTNLLSNLDPAFERRFIFKVEFKMPEKDSRARIWKSMIPSLSEQDAMTLAGRYSFSGGNIENIARKSTVEYVLSGNEPNLASLDSYCQEELLNRNNTRNKIGF
ncbi:MAG: ATP-binding protein [Bacteroidales bacterium]|nr:ATP-binding protein [Bacteroidales bacterium]